MSEPWSTITLEQWRRMFGEAYVVCRFDLTDIALDVGLTPLQAEGLKAWCARCDQEDDARELAKDMRASTLRFIESLDRDRD